MKVHIAFLILLMTNIHPSISGQPQIEIDSVLGLFERNAIQIEHADLHGINIKSALNNGILVEDARNGIYVSNSRSNGVYVYHSEVNGITVENAENSGINVWSAGGHSMNIQGSKSASTLEGHIGLIKNRSTTTNADVLALQVGTTGNPGPGNNFISFYDGSANSVGRIEGNGSGGILFGTSGGDFAECLPRLDPLDVFQPGDVVGVLDGRISHSTVTANQLMVITDRAAVLGNQPEDDENYEKVSFIGQIPVRVRGPVRAGDWIVASGLEDGTGMAIPSSQITTEHQIVGRAWYSSDDPGIKRVNTVVGLDHSAAKDVIIRNMQTELLDQRTLTNNLQKEVHALKQLISRSADTKIQP